MNGPNKGPQGPDRESYHAMEPPEPQEHYESHDDHADYKGGDPTQDPASLKAHEDDHTPNVHGSSSPEKAFHYGRGSGGVGL